MIQGCSSEQEKRGLDRPVKPDDDKGEKIMTGEYRGLNGYTSLIFL